MLHDQKLEIGLEGVIRVCAIEDKTAVAVVASYLSAALCLSKTFHRFQWMTYQRFRNHNGPAQRVTLLGALLSRIAKARETLGDLEK